jgi:hypothetical protein
VTSASAWRPAEQASVALPQEVTWRAAPAAAWWASRTAVAAGGDGGAGGGDGSAGGGDAGAAGGATAGELVEL